jgi:hypothetical protein
LSNLIVASPLTRQLRNFWFAPCEPGDAWQPEKAESTGPLAVPAKIFAGNEKMWPRHAEGIDLLELNGRTQVRLTRMIHLFFFKVDPASRTHLWLRIPPFLLETTASTQNPAGIEKFTLVLLASSGPFSQTAQKSRAALF